MSEFKYKHGLCVMRAQPFHIGHQKLIDKMLSECKCVTIVLGSIQEAGTEHNPFDYETRKTMITNVYEKSEAFQRLHICGLADINRPNEWGKYVLQCVKDKYQTEDTPDVYYAGSIADALCFKFCCKCVEIVDRNDPSSPLVSGTMLREMMRFNDARWKNFVPVENNNLIEKYFKKKAK